MVAVGALNFIPHENSWPRRKYSGYTHRIMRLATLFYLALLPALTWAQSASWQTGTVVRVEQHSHRQWWPRTLGTPGHYVETTDWILRIRSGGMLYYVEVDEDKSPALTENHDIQWMLDKDKVRYKDEAGKEHKARLIKKRDQNGAHGPAPDAPPDDPPGPPPPAS
jgi:hypothetical protein